MQSTNKEITSGIPQTMKAVGRSAKGDTFADVEVPVPIIKNSEYLVLVKAIAINPIDLKQRGAEPKLRATPRILDWEGAGIVVGKGKLANKFELGDKVIFTGDKRKDEVNGEFVALDENLVGPMPKNLTYAEAAAIPLNAVTAYEALFDRLQLSDIDCEETILIINNLTGPGPIASQLAKNLGMTVIGTVSGPESSGFPLDNGTDIVLDHSIDLLSQLKKMGYTHGVPFILVNDDPYLFWNTITSTIKPQGKICVLVGSGGSVDIQPLIEKSVTLVSVAAATRIKYDVQDRRRHNEILATVSKMYEDGELKGTVTKTLSPINAQNVSAAYQQLNEQLRFEKMVLNGFR